MKATNLVLLSTAVVVLGTWAKKPDAAHPNNGKLNPRVMIGGAFLAIMITALEAGSPLLADRFGWLILAAVVGSYGDDLFQAVGNVTTAGTPDPDKNGAIAPIANWAKPNLHVVSNERAV